MIIAKHFEFESAHQLPDIPEYGKCRYLHGHTYKLTVEVEGYVNERGWVINFKDLKAIVQTLVIDRLDHQNINNFVDISTAENILLWIERAIRPEIEKLGCGLYSLKLYETSNSYAYLKCK
jgi:6-pyruvoyltetrahydropterin/6-carboxytetrahydropterin synthase